jgi:dTDP-4-amino-4,6-dideoxygalactose transaminase
MDEINLIAKENGLKVLEDAAQSIGATYANKLVGSLGDAAAFSLHPLKNLHLMGDAGFISTNDERLYRRLHRLRNHGLINRNESGQWARNSRLDAIQAAFGNIKLKHLERWTKRFQSIAEIYHQRLGDIVDCPLVDNNNKAVFHNFVIQVPFRDNLMAFLSDKEIDTKIHYPIPIHLMACSADLGYQLGDFPETEKQSKRIVSLPIYPELTDDQVEYVCQQIQQFCRENNGTRN